MDNPYRLKLTRAEFMEVWESMSSELEHMKKEDMPEHYELVERIIEKCCQEEAKRI